MNSMNFKILLLKINIFVDSKTNVRLQQIVNTVIWGENIFRCSLLFCSVHFPVQRFGPSYFSVVPTEGRSGLRAPVKLSDSGTSGSRAGRRLESAATLPTFLRARDSASNTADSGGAGKLRYLLYL